MLDFDVKRCSRRCASTNAELSPGDRYYSVLVAEGAEVVRRDYSRDAWQGPPEGSLGWWKSQMPDEGAAKPKLAPSEVALELFDRWRDQPGQEDSVYVLALFLVRKRVFRFAETAFPVAQTGEETLRMFCPARAAEYDVPVVEVDNQRADEIQAQLIELLYSDAS
ncbi:hypothetical protein NG895_26810 [Aeoliella sp. ICT_H6.2]|uniref:Uncharacterized protein n=1 Tax=Aeoliella straminimaris TaxID=2954799 RepID=A0A9X2JJ63_9BACT|nr:hypothetical protein [Aeoliella straminimaris]MCO6047531.1 hypothetical protein [Aeoliella straminimaris]